MPYFDKCTTIELSYLKKIGMLDHSMSNSIYWSYVDSGKHAASIGIRSEITGHSKTLYLKYASNGEPVEYSVKLRSVESNLGSGAVWYFECPVTGLLCRNLYCIGKYFLHRKAFKNACYFNQDFSKGLGSEFKTLIAIMKSEQLYKEVMKKNYKRSYNGKQTKRYERLKRKADRIYPILKEAIPGYQMTLSNYVDWSSYDFTQGLPIV